MVRASFGTGHISVSLHLKENRMFDLLELTNGDNDLAGYLLAAVLCLPAGWIATKAIDWWDNL